MKLADGIIKLAIKLDRINSPLAYRLFKLATPVAFEADNLQYGNKPYEIVYRIQNASGKGFWQNPEEWNSIQDYNKFQNYETIKVTNNLPYLQVPHNDHGFLLEERQDANFQGRLFAFESTQQADRFIMPLQWTLLQTNGFTLVPVKARKIWSSGSQVYYEPY